MAFKIIDKAEVFEHAKAKAKLTIKQEAFCHEYLIDKNATQAAIRAGYSEKTAQSIGSEVLTHPLVAERIKQMLESRAEEAELANAYNQNPGELKRINKEIE